MNKMTDKEYLLMFVNILDIVNNLSLFLYLSIKLIE